MRVWMFLVVLALSVSTPLASAGPPIGARPRPPARPPVVEAKTIESKPVPKPLDAKPETKLARPAEANRSTVPTDLHHVWPRSFGSRVPYGRSSGILTELPRDVHRDVHKQLREYFKSRSEYWREIDGKWLTIGSSAKAAQSLTIPERYKALDSAYRYLANRNRSINLVEAFRKEAELANRTKSIK
jgi:hypothetical protein